MKVLYFSDNTSGHNQRFLEKLSQAGLEVWFLDPTSNCVAEGWLPQGVHWVRAKRTIPRNSDPATFADFVPEFQRVLREIAPDLVHAGPIQSCGHVTALSRFHPWLLTSWGSDLLFQAEQGPEWKQAAQAALSSADAFFCDCNTVRDAAKQLAEIPDSRIVQFPWGIRKGLFGPVGALPSDEECQRESGARVFISTRSWEPLYGIDILLEAFRQAYRVDSSLRLLLLGSGSEAGRVREFVDVYGLARVIRTLRPQVKEDMPKWFRTANAYVSCAQSDGTSVSLLEAMATGLPVVVSDIPSNREWVVEAQNGWLAPAGSSEEFADRLRCAARLSPEQRKLFSERNQRIVEDRADWDRNFPRLLEMYERTTGMSVISSPEQVPPP
ncbi:MAG: glycosyltransferase family 4 protein [Candidatus Sulfotelmatobacter sp.]